MTNIQMTRTSTIPNTSIVVGEQATGMSPTGEVHFASNPADVSKAEAAVTFTAAKTIAQRARQRLNNTAAPVTSRFAPRQILGQRRYAALLARHIGKTALRRSMRAGSGPRPAETKLQTPQNKMNPAALMPTNASVQLNEEEQLKATGKYEGPDRRQNYKLRRTYDLLKSLAPAPVAAVATAADLLLKPAVAFSTYNNMPKPSASNDTAKLTEEQELAARKRAYQLKLRNSFPKPGMAA